MKRILGLGVLLLWTLWPGVVAAQTAEPSATEPDESTAGVSAEASVETVAGETGEGLSDEELHDQLRALKAEMESAMNSLDLDAILERVDENVVFTTMNNDVVVGRDGVRGYFEKMMEGPEKVVDSVETKFVPEVLSILHGGDTAVSWGHTEDHYKLASGLELDISARWSGTMIRRDGRWVVASFHYSTNIFDNPVLSAQRRVLLGGGAVAALVCLALGFFLGRRRR